MAASIRSPAIHGPSEKNCAVSAQVLQGCPCAQSTSIGNMTRSRFAVASANLACASLWIALSALVIMFNKYILSSGIFPYPISLTVWHMIFSGSIASVLLWSGAVAPAANMDAHTYATAVLPISSLFAGTLWLGNAAYMYLSVSFIQMLKALMPAAVYFVGCVLQTESFSRARLLNMIVITLGVVLASFGEVAFVPVGVMVQLGSVMIESVRLALVQILLQSRGLKLNPITTLYYIAPASCVFLLVPWSVLESSAIREVLLSGNFAVSPKMLFLNASCAFALNLSVFLLIGQTSALTMNVAGVVKDWLLIGLSASVYHSKITLLNLQGYSIAFAGVCWYNWSKLQVMPVNKS